MGVLLTDPYLLLQAPGRYIISWCTEYVGTEHWVLLGEGVEKVTVEDVMTANGSRGLERVSCRSVLLDRLAEDIESTVHRPELLPRPDERIRARPVWRHSAVVAATRKCPYRVVSFGDDGVPVLSDVFVVPAPLHPREPVRILLTSDHQSAPLAAAAMQAAMDAGPFDAVVVAGDLVRMADRGSDWFDDARGAAFFATMQGAASAKVGGRVYRGAPFLQQVPLLPAPGNHEYTGDRRPGELIGEAFNAASAHVPLRFTGTGRHPDPSMDGGEQVVNGLTTYLQLFGDQQEGKGGWYARTVGDVRVVSLAAATIWRPRQSSVVPMRYCERTQDLVDHTRWGWGQHVLGSGIAVGSRQYEWLLAEVSRAEFRAAAARLVVVHNPMRHLGNRLLPGRSDGSQDDEALPFTDPVPEVERDHHGDVVAVRYRYPASDHLLHDLEPLLGHAGVELVLNGHNHLWSRFRSPHGPQLLETSNIAHQRVPRERWSRPGRGEPAPEGAAEYCDDYGLPAITPRAARLTRRDGRQVPYLAHGELAVFSVLDTAARAVLSYTVDPWELSPEARCFDWFSLDPDFRERV